MVIPVIVIILDMLFSWYHTCMASGGVTHDESTNLTGVDMLIIIIDTTSLIV